MSAKTSAGEWAVDEEIMNSLYKLPLLPVPPQQQVHHTLHFLLFLLILFQPPSLQVQLASP